MRLSSLSTFEISHTVPTVAIPHTAPTVAIFHTVPTDAIIHTVPTVAIPHTVPTVTIQNRKSESAHLCLNTVKIYSYTYSYCTIKHFNTSHITNTVLYM